MAPTTGLSRRGKSPNSKIIPPGHEASSTGQFRMRAQDGVSDRSLMDVTSSSLDDHGKIPLEGQQHGPSIESARKTGQAPHGHTEYDMPNRFGLLNELSMPFPVKDTQEGSTYRHQNLEAAEVEGWNSLKSQRTESHHKLAPKTSRTVSETDTPDRYSNLDVFGAPIPVENTIGGSSYQHEYLQEAAIGEQQQDVEQDQSGQGEKEKDPTVHISTTTTQLFVVSYLILFSFLGTLARLGLQALTFYPGAPVVFSVLWANFGGSLVIGFLSEDRMLFRGEWGSHTYDQLARKAEDNAKDQENGSALDQSLDLQAAKRAHTAMKRTIPLYIGLTTGFCGCFTSFSAFIRDVFLALSNNLSTPLDHPEDYSPVMASTASTVSRNGGYSFMALLAVIIVTISTCIAALYLGAHVALLVEPCTPALSFRGCRNLLDPIVVFLAWGCWIGSVFLAIFPPDRRDGPPEIWRGRAVFALVFAPVGCLGRFYASIYLNDKIPSFPLGTFMANVFGTVVLGMIYDLQHAKIGGSVGCQVFQGIEDGFCGSLTTVSTWVCELSTLRRRHAYRYGGASVVVALCFLIVEMGSMSWTKGFSEVQCIH